MAKNKATPLDELLAAINSKDPGSQQSNSFAPVSPAPISPFQPQGNAAATARPHAMPPGPPPASVRGNLNELESLFDRPAAPPQSAPSSRMSAFPQPGSVVASASQRAPPGAPPQTAALDPKMMAALRKQQLQAQKALQRREAMNAMHAARGTGQIPSNPGSQHRSEITSELAAVMAQSAAASNSARAQAQRGNAAAVATARQQRTQQAALQQTAANNNRSAQSRAITQEQIIVGHFCRHAIKTLARVMQNNPAAASAEVKLKEHIKSVWALWVRSKITRPQLLESVAKCVRDSCDEAAQIDVIREFKLWYEREYELQKQRQAGTRPDQARLQQLAQMKSGQPNSVNMMRNSAGQALPQSASRMASLGRTSPSSESTPGANSMKVEPQYLQGAAPGGKGIASKTVPARQDHAMGRGAVGKTAAGRGAGRGVVGRSVGGKSISRPPSAPKAPGVGRGQTIGKAVAAGRGIAVGRGTGVGKSLSIGRGSPIGRGANIAKANTAGKGVGGKGVVGGKGLLGSKAPQEMKAKAARKAPTKPPSKSSPKNAATKQKPPPANPAAFVNAHSLPVIQGVANGKRPLDPNSISPQGPLSKKAKPPPKLQKAPVPKKKGVGIPGSPTVVKGLKPPPARPDMGKGRPPKKPSPAGIAGSPASLAAKGALPGHGHVNTGPQKKPRRAEDGMDELSVVNNIVDIEDEEDKLGLDAGGHASEVELVFHYSPDMLLAGPRLRSKMQAVTRRFGLNENISKDTMEMISLAVRERLAGMMESMREIAEIRVESNKPHWNTAASGPNVYEKMLRMQQDEERSLQVAAEMRVKRRKEQLEEEAKKLAGEAANSEKKTKDSNAAAEAERKEKLALEKKKKEHSSQRDALSGLLRDLDKRRRKPNTAKGLAPLEPLGKKGLPPIPKMGGANSVGSGGSMSNSAKRRDPLEKLKALGPLVKLGRGNHPSVGEGQLKAQKPVEKQPLTLRDCLFLMQSEVSTRKSSLLYKWYARLGTRETK